jgi:hypothetical protein
MRDAGLSRLGARSKPGVLGGIGHRVDGNKEETGTVHWHRQDSRTLAVKAGQEKREQGVEIDATEREYYSSRPRRKRRLDCSRGRTAF